MNNHTYKCTDDVKDYCCIHHFVEKIIGELFDTDKDFLSTTIVAKGDLAQDLIRLLLSTTMEDDDDFVFHMEMVDFNSIEYGKEYYISINTDHEVWCEPAWHENGGYYLDESDRAYVYEGCDFKVLEKVSADKVTIFGFEEDED